MDFDYEYALAAVFDPDATVLAADGRATPHRVYAFFSERVTTPAAYVEFVDGEAVIPVVVHNFRDYGDAMRRWGLDPAELLALNELHELTHWAMTDAERERWDDRARSAGRADGEWFNPLLVALVRAPGERPDSLRARPSLLDRVRAWLATG